MVITDKQLGRQIIDETSLSKRLIGRELRSLRPSQQAAVIRVRTRGRGVYIDQLGFIRSGKPDVWFDERGFMESLSRREIRERDAVILST